MTNVEKAKLVVAIDKAIQELQVMINKVPLPEQSNPGYVDPIAGILKQILYASKSKPLSDDYYHKVQLMFDRLKEYLKGEIGNLIAHLEGELRIIENGWMGGANGPSGWLAPDLSDPDHNRIITQLSLRSFLGDGIEDIIDHEEPDLVLEIDAVFGPDHDMKPCRDIEEEVRQWLHTHKAIWDQGGDNLITNYKTINNHGKEITTPAARGTNGC